MNILSKITLFFIIFLSFIILSNPVSAKICTEEGDTYAVTPRARPCCDGLVPTHTTKPDKFGKCPKYKKKGASVCTKCGDGECGIGENICNCPIDCYMANENNQASGLNNIQIASLATEILKNTPEYIHFSRTAKFSWLLLSDETMSNPIDIRNEVIRQLEKKYKIYLNENDIPDHFITRDSDGTIIGYENGFFFSYSVTITEEDTIEVSFNDWEGNLAGSSHWKKYKWTGRKWKIVDKSPIKVS